MIVNLRLNSKAVIPFLRDFYVILVIIFWNAPGCCSKTIVNLTLKELISLKKGINIIRTIYRFV
jgi:hypothetical protein